MSQNIFDGSRTHLFDNAVKTGNIDMIRTLLQFFNPSCEYTMNNLPSILSLEQKTEIINLLKQYKVDEEDI